MHGFTAFGMPGKKGKAGLIYKHFFKESGRPESFITTHTRSKGKVDHYKPIISLWNKNEWDKFSEKDDSLMFPYTTRGYSK